MSTAPNPRQLELWSLGARYSERVLLTSQIRIQFPEFFSASRPGQRDFFVTATLHPTRTSIWDYQVAVNVKGRVLGTLRAESANKHGPLLSQVHSSGLMPTVPCRIRVRWKEQWKSRFLLPDELELVPRSEARLLLGEPADATPVNLPPTGDYRVLPPGVPLKLTGDKKQQRRWTRLLDGAELKAFIGVLSRGDDGEVNVEIDQKPAGRLSAAMGKLYGPLIDTFEARGIVPAVRTYLKGNSVVAEAQMHAARPAQISQEWMAELPASSPGGQSGSEPQPSGATPTDWPLLPKASGAAQLTIAELGGTFAIPPKPERIVFNPPPEWPTPPPGWEPPSGWSPDGSWPAPPEGWVFWVARDELR